MTKHLFLSAILVVIGLVVARPAVGADVDLIRAAEEYAQADAERIVLPEPWLETAIQAGASQDRQPILNRYARRVLGYQQSLSDGLTLRLQLQNSTLGPRIVFQPSPWIQIWSGPTYNPSENSIDGIIALRFSLWKFSL